MAIQGIDVSSVQGVISKADWASLKAGGTAFAAIKCGNGNSDPDPDYDANLLDVTQVGLPLFVYHFVYLGLDASLDPTRDPVAQARAHFQACRGYGSSKGQPPACIDIEWPAPEQWGKPLLRGKPPNVVGDRDKILADASAYLAEYERLQGRPPIVYIYPWFRQALQPPPEWARCPLWIADYRPSPTAEPPWAGWSIMQTSGGGGRLPDGAPVDTDAIADQATLDWLLNGVEFGS